MEVIHNLKEELKKDINEPVVFFLTNRYGSFFSDGIDSCYNGFFAFLNNQMFKIIDEIRLSGTVEEVRNNIFSVDRIKSGVKESFFMPMIFNSLVYELDKSSEFELVLDIRKAYDNPDMGRVYEIAEMEKDIVVKYYQNGEFFLYLIIKGAEKYEVINRWEKKNYSFDKKRNSLSVRHVFNALKLKGKKFVFSVSDSIPKAMAEANVIYKDLEELKLKESEEISYKNMKAKKDVKFAYNLSANSLSKLVVAPGGMRGIYAGLPWFFQFWARDELISLGALIRMEKYKNCKKIILRWLNRIQGDGRISNRIPSSELGSADAVGWFVFRVGELIHTLHEKKLLNKYFNTAELNVIIKRIEFAVNAIEKNYSSNGFITNNPLETWMDTKVEDDIRDGIRIEIQALHLYMLHFLKKFTKDRKYAIKEKKLRENVKKKFFSGKSLNDGIEDKTIRPNIFIAAYVYPELLTNKQWEKVFDTALTKLWLSWGGISTVDKENTLFVNEYTGEDNKSYHRGDSWFWLNNLAALVMHRVNKKNFKVYIDKILEASVSEILWKGAIGCNAELSSAKELRSEGCLNQAWSNAMFIELVDEVI